MHPHYDHLYQVREINLLQPLYEWSGIAWHDQWRQDTPFFSVALSRHRRFAVKRTGKGS
jgi:hypothetical protein